MPGLQSHFVLFGPLLVAGMLGVLVLVLRWAHRRGGSLVRPVATGGNPGEYGLLVPVDAPESAAAAATLQASLREVGVDSTLASTTGGLRVLVWPDDVDAARSVVRRLHDPPA